jgi:trehalose 6-phosphate phosphatase
VVSILSPSGRRLVDAFAQHSVLVAFDYDGTLAPISASPAGARMRATTRRLLRQVARRYPCAVISGRAYSDIAPRLRSVPLRAVFGNHGIEPLWARPAGATLVARWLADLAPRLRPWPGIWIEDKKQSLAIHYRDARNRTQMRRVIDAAIVDLKGVRAIDGRAAVNLLPIRGSNKGVALRHVCRAARCRRAIYVGDDGTDEDAFGALPPERLLSVRVGRRHDSLARYVLPSQLDVDALLRLLLMVRTPVPRRR